VVFYFIFIFESILIIVVALATKELSHVCLEISWKYRIDSSEISSKCDIDDFVDRSLAKRVSD